MKKNIILTNPEKFKEITISSKNTQKKIIITDFAQGSRNFSLNVIVEGENSGIEIIGRAECKDFDIKKWKIFIFLTGKNQKGILDLKGIANESGQLEFEGGGVIKKQSSGGDVSISEKIVLFSKKAKAKNIPILRVETENVLSANHSASITPFNKETIFFLETRGISEKEAQVLLRDGFLKI